MDALLRICAFLVKRNERHIMIECENRNDVNKSPDNKTSFGSGACVYFRFRGRVKL
jgi:hypothetical protein